MWVGLPPRTVAPAEVVGTGQGTHWDADVSGGSAYQGSTVSGRDALTLRFENHSLRARVEIETSRDSVLSCCGVGVGCRLKACASRVICASLRAWHRVGAMAGRVLQHVSGHSTTIPSPKRPRQRGEAGDSFSRMFAISEQVLYRGLAELEPGPWTPRREIKARHRATAACEWPEGRWGRARTEK